MIESEITQQLVASTRELQASIAKIVQQQPPPILQLPSTESVDEDAAYILGNSSGFLMLASSCAAAARGEAQDFDGLDWLKGRDSFQLSGFIFESVPSSEQVAEQTRSQKIWASFIVFVIAGVAFVVICAGIISVGSWVGHALSQAWKAVNP